MRKTVKESVKYRIDGAQPVVFMVGKIYRKHVLAYGGRVMDVGSGDDDGVKLARVK